MNVSAGTTVAEVGEFGLLALIRERLGTTSNLIIGPGDDAAEIAAPEGSLLVSSDLLLEGKHFRRDWSTAEDIGRKAAASNLSDINAMSSAAAAVKHGAVTVATEPGITMAGPCEVGDALGVVSGEFSIVGTDLAEAARDVVGRLLTPGSELVTLVRGVGGTTELIDAVEAFVRDQRVDLDVVVYDGDQENYPLFIAVE